MNFKNETIDMYSETTWYERRSKLEKLLLAAILFAALIILSLIIALKSATEENMCVSQECVRLSNIVLNAMNKTTNPCDDFQEYVCGSITNESKINKINDNKQLLRMDIKRILEEEITLNEPRHMLTAKTLYKACMNDTAIEIESSRRLKGILRDLGGWPLVEGSRWSNITFDWMLAIHKLRKIGYNFNLLIPVRVGKDVRTENRMTVYLDFPKISDFQEKLRPGYYNYMVDMSFMIGLHTYVGSKELREVYDFEMELLKIYPSEKYETRDYTKYTLNELQQKFSIIPWYEFINGILYPSAKLNFSEEVIAINSNYIRKVIALLLNTPKRTIANFIGWNVVHHLGTFINKQAYMIMKRHNMWKDNSFNLEKPEFIWEHCVDVLTSRLSNLVIPEYAKRNAQKVENSRRYLGDLAELVRMQFKNTIASIDWIEEESRAFSLEKLTQMRIHIGAPDKLLDNQLLTDIYEPVEIHKDQYLASILNVDFANTNLLYGQLHKKVSDVLWTDTPLPFHQYVEYLAEKNTLLINALHFDEAAQDYVNFASWGTIIAKEMAKLLTEGEFFGVDGIFQGWKNRRHHDAYAKKDQCLRARYMDNSVKLNIPDNVVEPQYPALEDIYGIRIAYKAYSSWINLYGEDLPIPGLNNSAMQMYWILYAYGECVKEQSQITFTKMHCKNLINEPLRYLVDFQQTFLCSPDSKMSVNTCNI